MSAPGPKPSTTQSLAAALSSWRIGAVTLLSFSSGMPLGLVTWAVPAWMAMVGVDIKTIGLFTLAQAPYGFKFLWSPLMDRYRLPFLGRKLGWIVLAQLGLAALAFALAAQGASPQVGLVAALCVLVAFVSASQDIAIDAYAVESLRPAEQGLAVGARTALYRAAMFATGSLPITLAPLVLAGHAIGWTAVLVGVGVLGLCMVPVAFLAPEPEVAAAPPQSLRAAVWEPFVDFFRKPRAFEIVAFLVLYKLADNLAISLVRPFLVQAGYDPVDVGIASGSIGLAFTIVGTFVGGMLTTRLGVGRALWLFGILQSLAGAGYALVAVVGVSRPLMYAAMALEAGASGMGTGAFSVLLMRLTQKRFSATQYALFSSVFALGRTLAGPIAGAMVDAIGWRDFFLFTIVCGAPGMAMLHRFVPWGTRELAEPTDEGVAGRGEPLTRSGLLARGVGAAIVGGALGLLCLATLSALKAARGGKPFELALALARIFQPVKPTDWLDGIGAAIFGLLVGFATAAYLAARRGVAGSRA